MINKSLLMGIAATAMLFSACSSSDDVTEKTVLADNQIQLTLNTAGNGLTSRTERPLYTTAEADNVNYITTKLYKYADGQWVIQDGCFDSEEVAWDRANTTNTIKIKNLDASTQYKVVAYGYNRPEDEACPYEVTENGEVLLATPKEGKNVEELFAGVSSEFQTTAEGRIDHVVNVEMKRMVSGLLAYFYNIPVYKIYPGTIDLHAVRYINVYTCASTKSFEFPTTGYLNGKEQELAKTKVIEFDLKEKVANYDEQVAAADNNFSALFTIDALEVGTVSTLPNSVIKGCYLIPFESHADANTLIVELADADNNVLKHWDAAYQGNFKYDIQRNHFYGLGKKVRDEATPAGPDDDPTDPDSPFDNPLDMSSVELTVSLIDTWDQVFYMTLE